MSLGNRPPNFEAPGPPLLPPQKPPVPLKVRHVERPFGRPRSHHLKITDSTITCRKCKVVVRRAPGATAITFEHAEDCTVFGEAA